MNCICEIWFAAKRVDCVTKILGVNLRQFSDEDFFINFFDEATKSQLPAFEREKCPLVLRVAMAF